MQRHPFVFQASNPRRSYRATAHSSDRLECLGTKYFRAPSTTITAISTDGGIIASTPTTHNVEGKVNIILAHANGFVKELYEPFIEHLLNDTPSIEAVFVHDVATQGASGIHNKDKLGDEYCWSDSGRDILCMIHDLRRNGLMTEHPLIGIGHSMGGCQIAYAAINHHRLFERLILIEPVIEDVALRGAEEHVKGCSQVASLSARRRDYWPSRTAAREKFSKSPFYQAWDPAVFEKWMEYGLIGTGHGEEVTLTTTVAQEVYSFMHFLPYLGMEDRDPENSTYVYRHLKTLQMQVDFLFGQVSRTLTPRLRGRLAEQVSRSSREDVEGRGHLIPMEDPVTVASRCAGFIEETVQGLEATEKERDAKVRNTVLTAEYKARILNLSQFEGVKAQL